MAKANINLKDWLVSHGLITDPNSAKQLRSGVDWVKRNLENVDLVSPKRGHYLVNESDIDKAYEAHLVNKDKVLADKQKAAFELNLKNKAFSIEEERRRKAKESPLDTPDKRKQWFATPEGQKALEEQRDQHVPKPVVTRKAAGGRGKGGSKK